MPALFSHPLSPQTWTWRWPAVLLLGCLLLSGLAGCNRRSGPDLPVSVDVTPQATAPNPDPPTPSPDLPMPTQPDLPASTPAQQLAMAQRQEQNGFLDEAATIYARLTRAADRHIAWQAAYHLGRLQVNQTQWPGADASLHLFFATRDSADPPVPAAIVASAHLLWAETQRHLEQFSAAEENYSQALAGLGELAFHIHRQWGQMLIVQGQTDRGLQHLAQAAVQAVDRFEEVQAREQMARVFEARGQWADAAQAYEAILAVSQNPDYRARMQYQTAQALLQAGDEEGAIARFHQATHEHRESIYAYLALVELVERQQEVDAYHRGYIDFHAGVYNLAVEAFTAYLAEAEAEDVRRPWALLYAGHAHFQQKDWLRAATRYRHLLAEYPDCNCASAAFTHLLDIYQTVDNEEAWQELHAAFRQQRPRDPYWLQYLSQSGQELQAAGEAEAAAAVLAELADLFPEDSHVPRTRFDLAMQAFLRGDHAEASDGWRRLREEYPWYQAPAVGYWTARTLWARGEPEAARFAWQRIRDRHPEHFFGIMSAQALHRGDGTSQNAVTDMSALVGPAAALPGDDGSEIFALDWMRSWAAPSAPAPARIEADIQMRRGRAFLRLGWRAQALQALNGMPRQYAGDAYALLYLMQAFSDLGLHRLSILAARNLYYLAPVTDVASLPLHIQHHLFPLPFQDVVLSAARSYHIPALYFYALLRQESLFEVSSVSPAAAQGLGQIIPDTGDWIALQTGFTDYHDALLTRPWLNLQFSAFYLAYVYEQGDRNWVSTLVGYNAGPNTSRAFREQSGPDDMLFLETVTIAEPVTYTRLIITYLYHYTRLYGLLAG